MKRVFCSLLLVIALSGFIMAGSEISANFMIGGAETEVGNYVPAGNFWDNYGSYIIGVLAVLAIGYFVFKMKDKVTSRRKKIKKVSRKITKKKI